MKRYILLIILLASLPSCAHVLSQEYVQSAVKEVGYGQIQKNPLNYQGTMFILGGTIVETINTADGAEIEVIQNPIDRYGDIIDRDISEGRFIVTTSRHLDPLIFKKGRMLTLAGKLVGSRKGMLGDIEYNYPLFDLKESYLWKKEKLYQPYMYDTFFYPYTYPYYWYDPYWHRP
ncbi:MAG: Slp family lipoprotein [Nitrospirae bacterium]|nr:Slp family lipoprotein [Nitrospirota bacterium]